MTTTWTMARQASLLGIHMQVVIGIGDPNPLVSGSGCMTLRDAGIEVVFIGGEEAADCYSINNDFMQRMQDEAKLKSGPAASKANSAEPLDSSASVAS